MANKKISKPQSLLESGYNDLFSSLLALNLELDSADRNDKRKFLNLAFALGSLASYYNINLSDVRRSIFIRAKCIGYTEELTFRAIKQQLAYGAEGVESHTEELISNHGVLSKQPIDRENIREWVKFFNKSGRIDNYFLSLAERADSLLEIDHSEDNFWGDMDLSILYGDYLDFCKPSGGLNLREFVEKLEEVRFFQSESNLADNTIRSPGAEFFRQFIAYRLNIPMEFFDKE